MHGAGCLSPGEVLCPGCTTDLWGQIFGAVTSVDQDVAVQRRLIFPGPSRFLFTSCICLLLLPGCQSITAPIPLEGTTEPWACPGGLFGELQVRACHIQGG